MSNVAVCGNAVMSGWMGYVHPCLVEGQGWMGYVHPCF
jgi:predicted DNA-binding transcriptional regulator